MIDATTAERVVTHPALASDIQSLTWGLLGVFAVVAGLIEGPLQARFGARGLFILTAAVFFVVAFPAGLGWLREKRLSKAEAGSGCDTCRAIVKSPQQAAVFRAAVVVCAFSLFLGLLSVFG
eukprot:COSAG04_NODE_21952_length_364_cov_0.777358_1_plen_121_part_11